MEAREAVIGAATLMLAAWGLGAQVRVDATEIDQVVIAKLRAQFGINAKVITRVDLTQPFRTKSRWTFVVAKQPDEESSVVDGTGERVGAVRFCFIENGQPDCSADLFRTRHREEEVVLSDGESPFYEFLGGGVVYSGPGRTLPLLLVKGCSNRGATGNCGVSTSLFDYDRKAERFRIVFLNVMGRNNNQEARFVESGPILGSVVVAYPTDDAPFTYFVEVYKRASGGDYSRVLKYRGKTGYGDGNPLAVIDSEMPETLRRLGFWRPGDPLPVPPRMPRGCTLVLRKGVEWCEPR